MNFVEYQFASNETVKIPVNFSHYQFKDIIGEGTTAIVILAVDTKNGKTVACKLSYRKFLNDYGALATFEKELRIHKRLNHPSIVPILDIIYEEDVIITVMNYYKLGDLMGVIATTNLHEMEILDISKKIIEALCYLHQRGIAHRDIKPENIVLDDKRNPILIDFGICTEQKSSLSSTLCGTMSYMAPEELIGDKYDAIKSDIWSLGVTLFVIATKHFPFKSHHPRTILMEMQNIDNILKETVRGKLYELLSKMLVLDPNQRKTAEELSTLFSENSNHFNLTRANTKLNRMSYKNTILDPSNGEMQVRDKTFCVRIIKPRVLSRSGYFRHANNSN